VNNRSALTKRLKLGEDNSDPIKVHPELNSVSSPGPSVRMLATAIFPKISVASTRMHLLSEQMEELVKNQVKWLSILITPTKVISNSRESLWLQTKIVHIVPAVHR